MATIKEIAKKCGVSIATVSNILNGKPGASEATRELVLKTAEKMEYIPSYVAKSLKTRNTRNIGVIAEDMTIFSIPDIIDGITEYCEKVDYKIFLTNLRLFKKYNDRYYHRDDYYSMVKQEIKKFVAMQTEGIIYVTAHERVMHCIPENLSIPAVMAYGYTESKKIPSVVVNDQNGAYELTGYLIEKGHRKIGVISGKPDSIHAQDRLLGYQKALRDNQLIYDPELVCYGDWTRESGYQCVEKLLEQNVFPQAGEIRFNRRDLERMPEGFPGRIRTIAAAKGGSLTLSDAPLETDGGFLLVYGGIEENCTLKAVFSAKREELSDQVNRMLFG